MTRWLRSGTQHLFVVTEAVAWFIVIRVLATTVDHGALTRLLEDVERGGGGPRDDPRVLAAAAVLRDGLDGLASGPSVVVVVVAAFAAVFLSRSITQLRLPRAAAALLGMVASAVILNALLHAALAGDLMFWDNSGLASFFDDPQTSLAGERDAESFVADPNMDRVRGSSLALIVFGMFALWARFLFVGRGDIGFDRALRSFSIGFPIVMVAALLSRVSGTVAGIFALPYFVLGMLTLAIANAARTAPQDEELTRSTPWAVSALVTMGLLVAVASLFGLIAVLEVERALTPIGSIVLRLISWLLVILLTPVFWIIEFVLSKVLSGFDPEILDNVAGNAAFTDQEEPEQNQAELPRWISNAFRLALFTLITLALYFVARYLFSRGRDDDGERGYEEERTATEGHTGLGGLLKNLIPGRRPRPSVPRWLDRHAVYRLFARAVIDAEDRGFNRRPGETPIEFAGLASRALDAGPFPAIAAEFDRARYGRHYPDDDVLRPLDRELSEWEQTHPATLELRQTVARDLPEDEGPPLEPPPDRPEPPPGTYPEVL